MECSDCLLNFNCNIYDNVILHYIFHIDISQNKHHNTRNQLYRNHLILVSQSPLTIACDNRFQCPYIMTSCQPECILASDLFYYSTGQLLRVSHLFQLDPFPVGMSLFCQVAPSE